MSKPTNTAGRFVWHELSTPNVNGSAGFYGELLGWKSRRMPMGPDEYTVISAGERDIGGIVPNTAGEKAPSSWTAYCTSLDVDAAVRRAKELGGTVLVGTVLVGATDIPGVGRFGLIRDPQGASLAPIRLSEEKPEEEGPPAVGAFCWDELLTSDPAAATSFYRAIFGWTAEAKDMGPAGSYTILKRGDRMAAGVMKPQGPGMPPSWLSYVAVGDLDASTRKAERLSARTLVPPTDIPGIGRFSVLSDPFGAVVALFRGTGTRPEEDAMQYLLLIYDREADWNGMPPEERGKFFAEYGTFTKSIQDSGNFRAGEALQPIATATTVRVRDGKVLSTDGPFAETREQLGGFYMVEAKDLDEAISIAARIPSARIGSIEVRPVMVLPPPG